MGKSPVIAEAERSDFKLTTPEQTIILTAPLMLGKHNQRAIEEKNR